MLLTERDVQKKNLKPPYLGISGYSSGLLATLILASLVSGVISRVMWCSWVAPSSRLARVVGRIGLDRPANQSTDLQFWVVGLIDLSTN